MHSLQRSALLRRARVEYRGSRSPQRLIIGIAQVHSVRSGRFSRWRTNQIAAVQTWIYEFLSVLYTEWGIRTFGKEGFSTVAGLGWQSGRLSGSLVQAARTQIKSTPHPRQYMRAVARRWRRALHAGNTERMHESAALFSALSLLQAQHQDCSVFPIEQRDVHGAIGQNLKRLRQEISQIEKTADYRSVRRKSGKRLTSTEHQVAVQRNALVRQYNAMLTHPERDRSIFREVMERAEQLPVTVFVLGTGHRRPILQIARQYIPDDTLFVWITPPRLWWPVVLRRWVYAVAVALVIGLIWYGLR